MCFGEASDEKTRLLFICSVFKRFFIDKGQIFLSCSGEGGIYACSVPSMSGGPSWTDEVTPTSLRAPSSSSPSQPLASPESSSLPHSLDDRVKLSSSADPPHRKGAFPTPATAAAPSQRRPHGAADDQQRVRRSSTAAASTSRVVHRSWLRGYLSDSGHWDTLHLLPTFNVVGSYSLAVLLFTLFLERYVVNTTDHIALFFIGSSVTFCSYFVISFGLTRLSTSFRRISKDKQFYTISNLIKAGALAAITPFACYQLKRVVADGEWDTKTLRNLGCIYAIPDFVSLLVVRRMGFTTVVHHLCVVAFNVVSIYNDYTEENVCRLIVVYAAFSTFGYIVYMLLASRFLGVSPALSRYLSLVALVVYVGCCAVNWTWQAWYLRKLLTSPHLTARHLWACYAYLVVIAFVMWDDLTLNRWLLHNVRSLYSLHQQRLLSSPSL